MPNKTISVRIDGELITAQEGQTILEVARANGREIPTLCYLKGLSAVGACRVCVVELAGTDRLLPACTTPMQEGMSINTTSAKLTLYRRMAVELLLVERNHICSSCVSNGHCELQSHGAVSGRHARALRLQQSPPARRHVASPLRSRSQPLHPVHALRARLR